VTVGLRTYRDVPLWSFLPALADALAGSPVRVDADVPPVPVNAAPTVGAPLTVEAVIGLLDAGLDERHGLLIEPGECLFASVDLRAPAWALCSAYYATMGFAPPAALGAGIADPGRRPVVLSGDGAFLMTGLEIAAAAFHGVRPIVVVLDNGGYGTQRPMLDGPFNDIPSLAVEQLPAVLGTGTGTRCDTEDEFAAALAAAVAGDELAFIHAMVPRGRTSAALARLTDALARRV
jgi:TPP-dependent 2-oxoacid decarboxylase